jgi:hypothetical protein
MGRLRHANNEDAAPESFKPSFCRERQNSTLESWFLAFFAAGFAAYGVCNTQQG